MPAYLLFLAALALPMLGCEQDVEPESVTVRRGNGGDPQTLDPAFAEDIHGFRVLADLYEGLVTSDAAGRVVAGAAQDWTVSDDGLRYTFRLRPDAIWSDGEPVTAIQFVTGMQRSLQPKSGSAYSFLLHPIRNAGAVERGEMPLTSLGLSAPDLATLVIELESPAPHFLSVLTMPIAFPVRTNAPRNAAVFSDADKFVGNGPFVLADWQPGHRIRLHKNKRFREAGSVRIDAVEYYAVQDLLTELNMYRAGELDITASVPGANVQELRNSRASELRIAPRLGIYYLAFDLSESPFDDLALRKALSMAIDREALTEVVGRGEQPAHGLIPDGVAGYAPSRHDWQSLSRSDREEMARQVLSTSNYAADTPLKLTYDAGDIHERVALAVTAMWRDVLDVDVQLDKREWQYFLETRGQRDQWQIMRFSWLGDYNHPSTFTDILVSTSAQNLPGYKSARFDDLTKTALRAQNPDEQARLIALAEAVMLDDYPIAPLYFYVSKHMVSPALRGFDNNVLDQHPSRYLRLDVAPAAP